VSALAKADMASWRLRSDSTCIQVNRFTQGRYAGLTSFSYFSRNCFELASNLSLGSVWGLVMLDEEFKKQRARTVRELAEKANDPFIPPAP
jgi:hypothetical protein